MKGEDIKRKREYIKGDKIHITTGPLKGWESIIKKIDRHKRQATVEIPLMGEPRQVYVPLEIIAKYERYSESFLHRDIS